jgi:hypothetical protein
MDAQAVAGLAYQRILAEGRFPTEAAAAVGACKLADRQREAADDRKRQIMRDLGERVLPEPFFEPPQVRRLTQEGGAVQRSQRGEEVGVLARTSSEQGTVPSRPG